MFPVLNKLLAIHKTLPRVSLNALTFKSLRTTSCKTEKMNCPTADVCSDIVWMDLEMTGLDVFKDKILEVSCVITDKDLNVLTEALCFAINHPPSVFEEMNEWCKIHHNKSGLVEKCLSSEITTQKGEQMLIEFLKQHIPERKCPLAGNSVYMDRLFLRLNMPVVDEYMHYRIIDVSTIKELARRWSPKLLDTAPQKKFAHRSLDDIYDSIAELKYLRQSFFKDS